MARETPSATRPVPLRGMARETPRGQRPVHAPIPSADSHKKPVRTHGGAHRRRRYTEGDATLWCACRTT
jgi:hypothetical protein